MISMEIYWALKMGKKVFFMNAMFSDDPHSPHNEKMTALVDNLLSKCDVVTVREEMSKEYAEKYLPHVKTVVYPDALFSWFDMVNDSHRVDNLRYYIGHSSECDEFYNGVEFNRPYALIAASSAGIIGDDYNKTIEAYCNLVSQAKNKLGMPVYLIQVCEGDFFLAEVGKRTSTLMIPMDTPILAAAKILAQSSVFISGRYHPAIMASLGGTPCVFMSSNSHKTRSVQMILEYSDVKEYPVIPTPKDVDDILDDAIAKLQKGDELRKKIKERARILSNEARSLKDLIK